MTIKKCGDAQDLFHVAGIQEKKAAEEHSVSGAFFAKEPACLVLSEEGLEKYRNSVAAMQEQDKETDDGKTWKDPLPDGHFASRSRSRLTGMWNQVNDEKKAEGRYLDTAEDEAESMLEAYARLRDEIIRGYEDGTRVTYEVDDEQLGSCRLLTKEEELELLDKTFQKMTKWFEDEVNWNRKLDEVRLKSNIESAQEIARRSGTDSDRYFACIERIKALRERLKRPKPPENLSQKMINGMQFLKRRSADTYDPRAIDQIISSIFSQPEE